MQVSLPRTCCHPLTIFVILKLVILICGEGTNYVALPYVISSMLLLLHLSPRPELCPQNFVFQSQSNVYVYKFHCRPKQLEKLYECIVSHVTENGNLLS